MTVTLYLCVCKSDIIGVAEITCSSWSFTVCKTTTEASLRGHETKAVSTFPPFGSFLSEILRAQRTRTRKNQLCNLTTEGSCLNTAVIIPPLLWTCPEALTVTTSIFLSLLSCSWRKGTGGGSFVLKRLQLFMWLIQILRPFCDITLRNCGFYSSSLTLEWIAKRCENKQGKMTKKQ